MHMADALLSPGVAGVMYAASAVAAGHRKWRAVAIASVGGVTPCGACRQFLSEFGMDATVILVDVINGTRRIRKLSQLLPEAFNGASLTASG